MEDRVRRGQFGVQSSDLTGIGDKLELRLSSVRARVRVPQKLKKKTQKKNKLLPRETLLMRSAVKYLWLKHFPLYRQLIFLNGCPRPLVLTTQMVSIILRFCVHHSYSKCSVHIRTAQMNLAKAWWQSRKSSLKKAT